MAKKGLWLRIDERTDVLTSLSLCLDLLKKTQTEPSNWKWAVLSLHNALQGAMVCHLSGTAQLGALSEKCVTEWLDWRERDRRGEVRRILNGVDEFGIQSFRFATAKDRPPKERLADAKELFGRLDSKGSRCEPGAGAILKVTDEQKSSFGRLHNLRNNFAHFTPKGWSIELSGLPEIFLDMVAVIDGIAKDPWSFRHLTTRGSRLLRRLVRDLRKTLKGIALSRKKRRAIG